MCCLVNERNCTLEVIPLGENTSFNTMYQYEKISRNISVRLCVKIFSRSSFLYNTYSLKRNNNKCIAGEFDIWTETTFRVHVHNCVKFTTSLRTARLGNT